MQFARGRWLLIGFEGSLVLVAMALGWVLGQPPLEHCTLSPVAWGWGLAGTLPMLVALAVCVGLPGPWRSLVRLIDETLVPMLRGWSLGEMALAAAMAGLGEEMLFRGVLQDVIARELTPLLAIVVAGVLFGLAHAISLAYAIFATLVGLYLGWLFVWSGDLAVPIVTHAVYDFVALVYLARFRRVRGPL
jgi:membrane protease YdiL (CAAX protease family)